MRFGTAVLLVGCALAASCNCQPPSGTYRITGTVVGLLGAGLTVSNGGVSVVVSAAGPLTVTASIPDGTSYDVRVVAQPTNPSQTCTVANGAGTIHGADAADVTITCVTDRFTVGGTLSGIGGFTGLTDALVLQDNGGDDLRLTANGSFAFATAVASGATYAVTVKTQPTGQVCEVTSGAGTVGAANVTSVAVTCSAGAGAWVGANAFPLPDGGLPESYTPSVGIDGSGNGLMLWLQPGATVPQLPWANRFVSGTGWGTAAPIGTHTAETPSLAVNAAGAAVAAWIESGSLTKDVWAATFTVAGGWTAPVLIDTDNRDDCRKPKAAIDPGGNAFVVWRQLAGSGTTEVLWAARFVPGAGWGAPVAVGTGRGNEGYPEVAVDPAGNAMVVWPRGVNGDPTASYLAAARYVVAGAGWDPPVRVDDPVGGASVTLGFQHVAFDGQGAAFAVWAGYDGTHNNILVSRYTEAAGGWSRAELLETLALEAAYPQVGADGAGNATAVWHQSDGTRSNIWSARYTPAGGWGPAELLETTNAGNALFPQVAVNAAGAAVAVWQQYNGTRDQMWANRRPAGGGWGVAEMIQSTQHPLSSTVDNFDVAISPGGQSLAVWGEYFGGHSSIWSNWSTN
jgi:hypothetical protein